MRAPRTAGAVAGLVLTLAACGGGSTGVIGAPSSPPLTTTPPNLAATASPHHAHARTPHKARRPVNSPGPTMTTPPARTTRPPASHSPSPRPTRSPTQRPKPTAAASASACANNSSTSSVSMENNTGNLGQPYKFSATSVTLKCGGMVTVTNNTVATHTFSPTNGGFTGTGDMSSHASRTVRFSYRGNYGFVCQIHSYMTGTVHVT